MESRELMDSYGGQKGGVRRRRVRTHISEGRGGIDRVLSSLNAASDTDIELPLLL